MNERMKEWMSKWMYEPNKQMSKMSYKTKTNKEEETYIS